MTHVTRRGFFKAIISAAVAVSGLGAAVKTTAVAPLAETSLETVVTTTVNARARLLPDSFFTSQPLWDHLRREAPVTASGDEMIRTPMEHGRRNHDTQI